MENNIKLTLEKSILNFKGSNIYDYKDKLNNKCGVYALYNPFTNKYYIGSSINLWNRIIDYSQPWFIAKYTNYPISKALVKYGYNNFIIIILEYTTVDIVILTEQKYIDIYKPQYNVLKIARSSAGYKLSEKTKYKIRLAKLGTTLSAETRDKISKSRTGIGKGVKILDETKNKLSIKIQGKNNNPFKLIEVLDINTGVTTTYKGFARVQTRIKVSHQTIKKYNAQQYKHYIFKIM
jgi:group I intron endonuclease